MTNYRIRQLINLKRKLKMVFFLNTENYQNMLTNMKFAIKSGGLIAITGIVGIGKTTTLRRLQKDIREENKILVSNTNCNN